jgi:hypothetical protein
MSVYEKNLFFWVKIDFLNFMALNEVIWENLLHTFEALYEGNVTPTFHDFFCIFASGSSQPPLPFFFKCKGMPSDTSFERLLNKEYNPLFVS